MLSDRSRVLLMSHSLRPHGPTVRQRLEQPGLRHLPVALDGGQREAKRLPRLPKRQPAEEPQLHEPALARIERGQLTQGSVEVEDVDLAGRTHGEARIEGDAPPAARPFARSARPRRRQVPGNDYTVAVAPASRGGHVRSSGMSGVRSVPAVAGTPARSSARARRQRRPTARTMTARLTSLPATSLGSAPFSRYSR
jgi:hypothetical protein